MLVEKCLGREAHVYDKHEVCAVFGLRQHTAVSELTRICTPPLFPRAQAERRGTHGEDRSRYIADKCTSERVREDLAAHTPRDERSTP